MSYGIFGPPPWKADSQQLFVLYMAAHDPHTIGSYHCDSGKPRQRGWEWVVLSLWTYLRRSLDHFVVFVGIKLADASGLTALG